MTPKQRRDSLFRQERPNIRPLKIYDGKDYHKDIKILWVAHQKKPFYLIESDNESDFVQEIMQLVNLGTDIYVAEDFNPQYKERGIVGVVGIREGWKLEPHVEFFPWATRKNILRSCVSFFQKIRYSRQVGCCVVHSLEESKNLFDHCIKYGVLHYVGKIINGDERGDEYIYSVRGKKCHSGSLDKKQDQVSGPREDHSSVAAR